MTQIAPEATCCPFLVIAARRQGGQSCLSASGQTLFSLQYAPTGRAIATAPQREPLRELAQRFAWFDWRAVDPEYLADGAHVELAASVRELVAHWRTETVELLPQPACLDGSRVGD